MLTTLALSYNHSVLRWRVLFIGEETTLDFDNGALLDGARNVPMSPTPVVELRDQDKDFVRCIVEQHDPSITGEDVLPAMQVLESDQTAADAVAATP